MWENTAEPDSPQMRM